MSFYEQVPDLSRLHNLQKFDSCLLVFQYLYQSAVAVYVSLILFLFDERDDPGNFQLIWVFVTADNIVEEVEDC